MKDFKKNGVTYCGKCKEPKERILYVGDKTIRPHCMCKCEREEAKKSSEVEQKAKVESKQDQLKELKTQINDLQKQVTDIWISNHRQSILTFARECRAKIDHDAEEWNHILSIADEYETYCSKHAVSNGVVKADTMYIRGLYQELSRGGRI